MFVKVNLEIFPLMIRAQIVIFHKLLVFYSLKGGKDALETDCYGPIVQIWWNTLCLPTGWDYSTGVGKNDRAVVRLRLKQI